MKIIIKILSSGFGSGYSPFASGTAGSALAAVMYWFLFPHSNLFLLLVLLPVFALSVPVSTKAERIYGKKDDSHIVIDEIVGYWVSVLFLPYSIPIAIAAFIIFRIADVIKPFFIRRSQDLPGGWGIVIDDVLAGILTNVILQITVRVFGLFQ